MKKYIQLLSCVSIILITIISCNHIISDSVLLIKQPIEFVYAIDSADVNFGTSGVSVTPNINNGGGLIIFSINSPINGITIDSLKGIIKWDSTLTIGNKNLVITASNSRGAITANYLLKVKVIAPNNFSYNPAISNGILGKTGTSGLPTLNTGGDSIIYSISTPIVGVSINAATGVISWASTLALGSYKLTIKAANNVGNVTTTFTLVINAVGTVVAPSNFAYLPAQTSIVFGVAGISSTPTINAGGGTIAYSVTGAPTGVTINSTTGVISWASSVGIGTYTIAIKAANSISSITVNYILIVNNVSAIIVAPTSFLYSPSQSSTAYGIAGISVVPSIVTGGGTIVYSVVNTLIGVTVNAATGVLSWAATLVVGTYPITIKATNNAGNTLTTYTIVVIGGGVSLKLNPDNFLMPKFAASDINVTTTSYGPTSGTFHLVDVYVSKTDTTTRRPVIMFLHGGGFQSSGIKTESYVVAFCTYLARCGYVAFAPNYNEGSGHTFAQNLAAAKDADMCLNWIRASSATYKFDPNYLFVGGGSAGAHLACNFNFFDGNNNYGGYNINLTNVIAFADCWGSSPNADRLYNFSSLNSSSMPVFIVQGSADQTVPILESRTLNSYLVAAKSLVNFWEIPGETHGCPNHIPAISDSMSHFFNKAWKLR